MNQSHEPMYQHFTPWRDHDDRSCWTCTHATSYDGVRTRAEACIEERFKCSGLVP